LLSANVLLNDDECVMNCENVAFDLFIHIYVSAIDVSDVKYKNKKKTEKNKIWFLPS